MTDDLLNIIYNDSPNLIAQIKSLLDAGADPNHITKYQESPLRVASNNARFEVIKMLISYGADETQLGWTPLFHTIVYGNQTNLEEFVTGEVDLEHRDFWERTPFLIALLTGDIKKTKLLVTAGVDVTALGRNGKSALMYAIQNDDGNLLEWLLDEGFDIEQGDFYSQAPLSFAAQHNAVQCVKKLIERGADVLAVDHIPQQAIERATNLEIVQMLIKAGADINDMDKEARDDMLGYASNESPEVSETEFRAGRYRVYGRSNPELSRNPFWHSMIKSGASAYQANEKFKVKTNFSQSKPTWSYDRFGKSITPLPDGRFIEIAGEHEDHYDPDFCIYNDVFVHDSKGGCNIYTYPREVFLPTDFHTATLVGDVIYVIGNLGYAEDRKAGYTQVFALNINDLSMKGLSTKGDMPGWIGKHKAVFDGLSTITLSGGKLIIDDNGQEDYIDNQDKYSINIDTLTWNKHSSSSK